MNPPARILTPTAPFERDPGILEAADLIRSGGLVAFPTETVYGLGADATDSLAVERIYAAKGRPLDNPCIIHVGHNEDILRIGVVEDARILALFKRFWPGALTMVIPAQEPYRTSVGRGLPTVAVRMPGHPVALALIHAAGVPLAAPSANASGRPSPTTAQHVFADLGTQIPLILDGGPSAVGIESTVVDLSGPTTRILRPGLISAQEIAEVLGMPVEEGETAESVLGEPRSPGMRHAHYQPSVPVHVLPEGAAEITIAQFIAALEAAGHALHLGYIARRQHGLPQTASTISWRVARHPEALTRHFYAYLRELDALGVDAILVDAVAESEPVMDRIRRAAGG